MGFGGGEYKTPENGVPEYSGGGGGKAPEYAWIYRGSGGAIEHNPKFDYSTIRPKGQKYMKPFDLDKAKTGHPIATSDGRAATFIAHIPYAHNDCRVIVMLDSATHTIPSFFMENGVSAGDGLTLVMKPLVKYANLYSVVNKYILGSVKLYDTKEEARTMLDPDKSNEKYIKTIAIEVE